MSEVVAPGPGRPLTSQLFHHCPSLCHPSQWLPQTAPLCQASKLRHHTIAVGPLPASPPLHSLSLALTFPFFSYLPFVFSLLSSVPYVQQIIQGKTRTCAAPCRSGVAASSSMIFRYLLDYLDTPVFVPASCQIVYYLHGFMRACLYCSHGLQFSVVIIITPSEFLLTGMRF